MDRWLSRRYDIEEEEGRLPARVIEELGRALARRGQERLDAIADSSDPRALVGAMAPSEVFYTYGELDEDGRRLLVHLASDRQVDFLLDLDLWDGEQITPARALEWIERLVLAGADQAARWVLRTDSELVVTLLQKLIVVTEGPVGSQAVLVEAQDSLPPFTAEGVYYIYFKVRGSERLLKTLLLQVASADLEYYLSLLLDVIGLTHTEAQEEALLGRWNRLRDDGFRPPEEAYEIYRWPRPSELELETGPEPGESDAGGGHTSLALVLAGPTGLLASAIEGLEDRERVELSRSLALTGSRILSADNLPLGELGAHRQALGKALGYVNIGLERLAAGDVERARAALTEKSATLLFRLGYSEVAGLARRATALRRQGWLRNQVGLGPELLGEPLGDVVDALVRPRPLFAARALAGEGRDRPFRGMDEVARCAEVLDRADALRRLFIDGLGLDLAPAEVFDLTGCIPESPADLSLGLILRTAIAHLIVEGALRFTPVPASHLPLLVRRLGALLGHEPTDSELRHEVFDALRERIEAPTEIELHHLGDFVDQNLAELRDALGGLDPNEPVDPRFVGAFVIRYA